MKVHIDFWKASQLPVEFQPDVVTYDFADRGYSPELLARWLAAGLLSQAEYNTLLRRLPTR